MKVIEPGSRLLATTALVSLSALHLVWAIGSPWPASTRESMAAGVSGTDRAPGAVPTLAVAGALASAAALVSGAGGNAFWARAGRAAVASVFAIRGAAGIAGRTEKLVRWQTSEHFKRLDRRYYGPASLSIAVTVVLAGISRPSHDPHDPGPGA